MKINFFKNEHVLFPFRWYIIILLAIGSLMTYFDITGMRMMSFSGGQQWNAQGPGGYHK